MGAEGLDDGEGVLLLPFDHAPAFLLNAAFRGINEEELTALLQLRVPRSVLLAFVVIAREGVPRFIGVDPFG